MEPFSYGTLVALNAVVIVLIGFFAGCYGRDHWVGTAFAAGWAMAAATSLSFLGWATYVIAHFLGKFW